MMKLNVTVGWRIARDEWLYWNRSKLAVSVLVIGILLTLSSVIATQTKIHELSHQRTELQTSSEDTFMEQPDRHPHRMVHYGHYAFRTPSPLSMLDPGVDAYTGNAIFLEGHRQNSATFAEQQQSTGLAKLGSLSPAFVVQNIAPLILILIGYSSVSRERESQTLAFLLIQGVSTSTLFLGKIFALVGAALLILLPLAIASVFAVVDGEPITMVITFLIGYFLYLLVWVLIVVLASTMFSKNSSSFTALIFTWIALCIVIPRVASSTASVTYPVSGKLESDFAVIAELRKLGDGHNANDPAFEAFKAELLEKYEVDTVDELPINFRGAVASRSEAELSEVLNQFAEQRMQSELAQTQLARMFGWLSPNVSIRSFSMISAGTSIESYHRFLRETEELRYNFVQGLNQVHIEQLNYQDDLNRNQSQEAGMKARVSAENWDLVAGFEFQVDAASSRMDKSVNSISQLLFWLFALVIFLTLKGKRLS
jgi:ABC-2 type transport system permease protein